MKYNTTRFGLIYVPDYRAMHFADGLLGFTDRKRFALLEPGDDAAFWWLQSLDEPSLAFVVTDPSLFCPDYSVPLSPERFKRLGLTRLEDAQVFVIVNKTADGLTGNMAGPCVVNTINREGMQFVIPDQSTRRVLTNLSGATT